MSRILYTIVYERRDRDVNPHRMMIKLAATSLAIGPMKDLTTRNYEAQQTIAGQKLFGFLSIPVQMLMLPLAKKSDGQGFKQQQKKAT